MFLPQTLGSSKEQAGEHKHDTADSMIRLPARMGGCSLPIVCNVNMPTMPRSCANAADAVRHEWESLAGLCAVAGQKPPPVFVVHWHLRPAKGKWHGANSSGKDCQLKARLLSAATSLTFSG